MIVTLLLQQIIEGIASGCIYGLLGLAIVMGFRATGVVNLALGEMAMLSAFVAIALVWSGVPLYPSILVAVIAACALGGFVQVAFIRVLQKRGSEHGAVILTIGLLLAFNSLAGTIWRYDPYAFPSIFPEGVIRIWGLAATAHSLGVIALAAALILGLNLLFRRTRLGLAMRAVASSPDSSRLVGIKVDGILIVGWAISAGLGALAGILIAPSLFLSPYMMGGVLGYALAAAALGGFDSPFGAVLGGIVVGLVQNLAGTYIGFIGSDLRLLTALAILVAVLLVRPQGLFGRAPAVRA